jgi:formylglycine-generating enzyme required for sulfatase activity
MKLFVSYRSSNSDKVDTIVTRLRSPKDGGNTGRYAVWQDKDSIPPAMDWWEAIVNAIIDCDVMLFMVSRESVQNVNCRAELTYARKRNRAVVPVVLEGEFTYNPTTGKNDIDYWAHVPTELNDLRAQFLFYEGASFITKLETALDHIRQEPQRWRDIPAPKPPDPRPAAEANSDTAALYDEACDYALRWEYATAERLFLRLVNGNDPDFGPDAHEWILILRDYDRIVRWDARDTTRYKVADQWVVYSQQFPRRFISFFDPKGLQARYSQRRSSALPPPARKSSFDILPKPFAWIPIPKGEVTLKTEKDWKKNYIPEGKTQTFPVAAFDIGKYPVTNAQFALFVKQGYTERRWWTDAGWEAREQGIDWNGNEWAPTGKPWTEPRFWNDKSWNRADYPVVGVSWYECVAYCQWLSELTGEIIMLPTEQQWQRAAQGDTAWAYPWGDKFDKNRCNFNTSGTTPVTQYEGEDKGDSPFGVVDMSGNVWEWCLTAYESGSTDLDGTDDRVLRGGSWNDYYDSGLRADFRNWLAPTYWYYFWGFRLARS